MRIVSFDLSLSATGWCVSLDGAVEWGVFNPPGLKDIERIDWIARQCAGWVKEASLVVMEDRYSSSDQYARELCGVTYMIRHWLWRHQVPLVLVAPATLKKFATGSGGSKKNPVSKGAVMKDVYRRWEHDVNDDNAADAIVLAYIGRGLVGEWWMPFPGQSIIAQQREVVAALAAKYPDLPKVA